MNSSLHLSTKGQHRNVILSGGDISSTTQSSTIQWGSAQLKRRRKRVNSGCLSQYGRYQGSNEGQREGWGEERQGRDHSEYMGRWGKRRDTIGCRKRDPLIRESICPKRERGGMVRGEISPSTLSVCRIRRGRPPCPCVCPPRTSAM